MFENLEKRTDASKDAARPPAPRPRTWPVGILISSLVILSLAGFVAWDLSAVFFFKRFQENALRVVEPDMRLTEAERALNAAGYLTRYHEDTPEPVVEVSLMKHESLLLKGVQMMARPGIARDFRAWISEKSSFALAQSGGKLMPLEATLSHL